MENVLMKDLEKILLTEEEIKKRVRELGEQISGDFKDTDNLLTVCVLRGAIVVTADLIRELTIPAEVDCIIASSYGLNSQSSGNVNIRLDLLNDIAGRDVLVMEDIVDTGYTIARVMELLESRHPRTLKLCALMDKPSRRKIPVNIDYCGFEVPDYFLVGYGLDYADKYRNFPFVAVLKKEVYAK